MTPAVRPWPRFMTARTAALYAHTSPWTIRRHVQPCGRRGRNLVYAFEDVERWMGGVSVARPAAENEGRALGPTSAIGGSLERIRELGRGRSAPATGPLASETDDVAPSGCEHP